MFVCVKCKLNIHNLHHYKIKSYREPDQMPYSIFLSFTPHSNRGLCTSKLMLALPVGSVSHVVVNDDN